MPFWKDPPPLIIGYQSPYGGYAQTRLSVNSDDRVLFAYSPAENLRYDLGPINEHLLMEADYLQYGAITMKEFLWRTQRGFQERMDGHMLTRHRERIYQHFRYGIPLPGEVQAGIKTILEYLQEAD
jgi:hypothetical protein